MRTDERAGQDAKYTLMAIEDSLRRQDTMDPDGAYIFMTPDERKIADVQIDILRRVCGIT